MTEVQTLNNTKNETETQDYKELVKEISYNLGRLYSTYPIDGYLDYLKSLNLEILPQEMIEDCIFKLDNIIKLYSSNIRGEFKINKKTLNIFWFQMLCELIVVFNSLIPSSLAFLNISKIALLIVETCFLGKTIKEIVQSYLKFKKKKKMVVTKAEQSKKYLTDFISMEKSIASIKHSQEHTVATELIKSIGEKELANRITELEGKILLLPKAEEKALQDSLKQALAKYKEDLKVNNTGEITLILKSKLECLRELNEKLDEIESTLNSRNLFVTEKEFYSQLSLDTENFLNSIRESTCALDKLINLMQKLAGISDCNSDLLKQIEIQNSFAICFWTSINILTDAEIKFLLECLTPIFIDRIILEGERELDNLEQTINIIGTRTILLNIKNSENYNKIDYLRQLIFYVKEYSTKNITRLRAVTTN